MNQQDHGRAQDDGRPEDEGWVDPAGTGLLKQTFGVMADGVDPASPSGPAATMTAMSRRVRRRRTAKLGGLGGGALALAGAVVLGAGQLAPSEPAELLPAASSAPPDFELQDGYQPPWLDWSDLTCGMPVADLESTAPGWSVASAGDIYGRTADLGDEPSTSWGMAWMVEEGTGTLDSAAALVWSQDGVVLDLGPNVFEAPRQQSAPLIRAGEEIPASKEVPAAIGGSVSTCAPTSADTDPVYETPLPEGDYEVRVVAFPRVEPDGRRATAVSEPVQVRLDADGAHSAGEARGESTIEFPKPVEGEISRFALDRTTDWVTAEMTQRGYSSDTPMRVIGQCEGGDPEAVLPIELVLPSTGDAIGETQISCDGDEAGSEVEVLDGDGEAIDIRLPSVPDGVARLWVSLEPATPPDTDTSDDCSATGYDTQFNLDNFLTGDSAAAVSNIVLAAEACDSAALIALAEDSETELLSGTETPEQVFALPEGDAQHYRTLVALLANTRGEVIGGEIIGDATGDEIVVWPRVATEEFADSDEAWDEVVAAGLLTDAEADAQRADGYQGMRIGMTLDGTWKYYSAGD